MCRLLLALLLAPVAASAKDLFVAPAGTPAGPGTLAQPYDLATSLSGSVSQPGDRFWLTGGNYAIGHIDTRIHGAPGQLITFRSLPGQQARVDGSLSFFESVGNVVLRDIELYSSDTNRVSSQTNAGFGPTDITIIPGIASYSPNMSFINLVVHDETRHGFYISQVASNNLIYGCVVYNNGWRSPDNAEGHGIYVQGTNGGRVVADNIVFNNSGVGMHIYENTTGHLYLAGITLDGNVAFNAGAIQNIRAYRDWIVGVDPPSLGADDIVLANNMAYLPPSPGQEDNMQVGREGVNGQVTILNNYLPAGLQLNNWTTAAVLGNVLAAQSSKYAVCLNETLAPLVALWNGNTYGVPPTSTGFCSNSNALSFLGWQIATGFDLSSTCAVDNLSGTRVFVRPNYYEPGRANLIVYNWNNLSNVTVDVSQVLSPGAPYEVRNAEDPSAAPVLAGVFDGQPLNLPMTGLTVAVPNGPMVTPQPTGPTFNVFLLQPRAIRLQVAAAGGLVRITWPTNAGNWILQSSRSLSTSGTWTNVMDNPVVEGNQFTILEPAGAVSAFYRLQAQ